MSTRKKLSRIFLCIALICLVIGGTAMAAGNVPAELYIDGEKVGEAGDAFLVDDSTVYVPLRAVTEALGAQVSWNGEDPSGHGGPGWDPY